jgi:hypothetical protein
LICTGAGDDNLDIDWGYQGRLQHVIVQQSNDTGDHIVESDNTDSAGDYKTEPRSNPIVANFTFISRGHDDIFKLKEGVSGQYYNGVAAVLGEASGLSTGCIETTTKEVKDDGAITPNFSFNSVAFDCDSYISTDIANVPTSATVAQIQAIVEAGSNNLYGANSGGGNYVNNLGKELNSSNALVYSGNGVAINGPTETAATVTAIPSAYNTDSFFDTTTHIGAVSGPTDDWYKVWTVPGSIKLN